MIDLSAASTTRLFTAFGTVLYIDIASGELRHGPIESSPANAVFVADSSSAGPYRRGRLTYDSRETRAWITCFAERCHVLSGADEDDSSANPTILELIPLERGLITFKAGNLFLSAIPDGRILLRASACSTWELFLASEDWCADQPGGEKEVRDTADASFDHNGIKSYIVHPIHRARANTKPKAGKILIYGYTKWSHGRVYYDLCKHLHQRGYIVDILNWQGNHADYVGQIFPYYDLFITALDGVGTLVDIYGIPYDRIIALSHHELDIRMLIEQKGIEVFDKFANYGVVSEYLYCASFMRGVPRVPMVASLGVNFSEFHSDISKGLETVGYAGSMSVSTYGIEWKRGELAEVAACEAGLAFKVAGSTANQIPFHDMPRFYRSVDAVLMTSISESGPLTVMEAAAAGRLVIGTPVGHFALKAYQGGGIIAPIEAGKFKSFTAATLRYYKDNPTAYVDKCRSIQEAARKFDWQYSIGGWVELIEAARSSGKRMGSSHTTAPPSP
jgi:glycosyltransferase involved in cell wall biosynthesis